MHTPEAMTKHGSGILAPSSNVLMIYPRFSGDSFWNYTLTAELFGARYPTIWA